MQHFANSYIPTAKHGKRKPLVIVSGRRDDYSSVCAPSDMSGSMLVGSSSSVWYSRIFKAMVAAAVLLLLLADNACAQVVYVSKWKSEAQWKVYVSTWKSEADMIVYKTEWKSEAEKDGYWYYTTWKSEAGKIIYFTEWKSEADVIVYFTEWKSEAGWTEQGKKKKR